MRKCKGVFAHLPDRGPIPPESAAAVTTSPPSAPFSCLVYAREDVQSNSGSRNKKKTGANRSFSY